MADVDPAVHFAGEREMLRRDRASAALGMVVERDEPGDAAVSMLVRDDMTNGFGITHGGVVFALADTAFAMACNDGEAVTVSAGADIAFLASTRAGDRLTAHAVRRSVSGRSGIYDVTVTSGSGAVVAEFRGRARTLRAGD
ncbi:acyl-CoA thioesterase [Microbacterium terrae]|uniref:Acyl-coenzyme A thioesterase PaaI n=1 Tax=Microbacterium terrae TaxID=69369 RepID=A0A0M2GZC4_9MICO|nr:hydroxyphenylacetyl-CoA thioesterase PaaI [Microbacterium terrae]KJL39479.1 Acyl-coenzyme A thioesterase PaaI [Microbacterium terrae]MBP1078071.1 acyl-CoA thioesterase [Microbacterium terrae]GLK00240.1 phenylacetic acid degradation protein PaaD [Microbacterium terrae]